MLLQLSAKGSRMSSVMRSSRSSRGCGLSVVDDLVARLTSLRCTAALRLSNLRRVVAIILGGQGRHMRRHLGSAVACRTSKALEGDQTSRSSS